MSPIKGESNGIYYLLMMQSATALDGAYVTQLHRNVSVLPNSHLVPKAP